MSKRLRYHVLFCALQDLSAAVKSMFNKVDCFGLQPGQGIREGMPPLGLASISKIYGTGIDAYARRVFGEQLQAKVRHTIPVVLTIPCVYT
jgi:hypothetical protein